MLFNDLYKGKSDHESESNDLAFFRMLIDKIFKKQFIMRQEYFNWTLSLLTDPKLVTKGFKKINFLDKIAAF